MRTFKLNVADTLDTLKRCPKNQRYVVLIEIAEKRYYFSNKKVAQRFIRNFSKQIVYYLLDLSKIYSKTIELYMDSHEALKSRDSRVLVRNLTDFIEIHNDLMNDTKFSFCRETCVYINKIFYLSDLINQSLLFLSNILRKNNRHIGLYRNSVIYYKQHKSYTKELYNLIYDYNPSRNYPLPPTTQAKVIHLDLSNQYQLQFKMPLS